MKRKQFILSSGAVLAGAAGFQSCSKEGVSDKHVKERIGILSKEKENLLHGLNNRPLPNVTTPGGFNGCQPVEVISTDAVRSTFDVVRLSGGMEMAECGIMVSMKTPTKVFSIQCGFRKNGGSTIPFTDYSSTGGAVINIINGTAPFLMKKKNVWEVYKYDSEKFRYKRNGMDILEFDFKEAGGYISYINAHTLKYGGNNFSTVNWFPCFEYKVNEGYIHAIGGKNIYCASDVGFNSSSPNNVNSGTGIIKTECGIKLW